MRAARVERSDIRAARFGVGTSRSAAPRSWKFSELPWSAEAPGSGCMTLAAIRTGDHCTRVLHHGVPATGSDRPVRNCYSLSLKALLTGAAAPVMGGGDDLAGSTGPVLDLLGRKKGRARPSRLGRLDPRTINLPVAQIWHAMQDVLERSAARLPRATALGQGRSCPSTVRRVRAPPQKLANSETLLGIMAAWKCIGTTPEARLGGGRDWREVQNERPLCGGPTPRHRARQQRRDRATRRRAARMDPTPGWSEIAAHVAGSPLVCGRYMACQRH